MIPREDGGVFFQWVFFTFFGGTALLYVQKIMLVVKTVLNLFRARSEAPTRSQRGSCRWPRSTPRCRFPQRPWTRRCLPGVYEVAHQTPRCPTTGGHCPWTGRQWPGSSGPQRHPGPPARRQGVHLHQHQQGVSWTGSQGRPQQHPEVKYRG